MKRTVLETEPDAVFANAVPHESGHVLVAYRYGIPVREISIQVRSATDGNVVSMIQFPRPDEFADLAEQERNAYCVMLAGGIAGERFANGAVDPSNSGAMTLDKVRLKDFTDRPMADFEPKAAKVIDANRRQFRQLCSKLKARYPEAKNKLQQSGTGEVILVAKKELDDLLRAVQEK